MCCLEVLQRVFSRSLGWELKSANIIYNNGSIIVHQGGFNRLQHDEAVELDCDADWPSTGLDLLCLAGSVFDGDAHGMRRSCASASPGVQAQHALLRLRLL